MPLYGFLSISLFLLSLGLFIVITRRHIIALLMGIELMLWAASLNMMVFSQLFSSNEPSSLEGRVLTFFIILFSAARISVALTLCLSVYRDFNSTDTQHIMTLKG